MKLLINGEEREFSSDETSIPRVLEKLELAGVPVVVEHNEEALLPKEHAQVQLKEGDRLEIVRVVAGG